jgi:hypothetical protein
VDNDNERRRKETKKGKSEKSIRKKERRVKKGMKRTRKKWIESKMKRR